MRTPFSTRPGRDHVADPAGAAGDDRDLSADGEERVDVESHRGRLGTVQTDLLYLRDAYLQQFDGDGRRRPRRRGRARSHRVLPDRRWPAARHRHARRRCAVTDVRKEGDLVWHTLDGDARRRRSATPCACTVDWERRHRLMRTHTALHVLCGVIWNEWRVPVTGGNMEPLTRPHGLRVRPAARGLRGRRSRQLVNAELAADRPIEVSFLPRDTAVHGRGPHPHEGQHDPGVGARRSASSTSSASTSRPTAAPTCARTGEVGRIRVVKTESQGQGQQAHPPRDRRRVAGVRTRSRCSPGSVTPLGSWRRRTRDAGDRRTRTRFSGRRVLRRDCVVITPRRARRSG